MKIAAVQTDIEFGSIERNLQTALTHIEQAQVAGARLVVFPECSLSGYCCDTHSEAVSLAIPLNSQPVARLIECCRQLRVYVVVGFLESNGEEIYNSLVCLGPDGVVANYRKTHLPKLGVDRFVTCGRSAYRTFEIENVRVGMLICYDCSFPEATRILALQGADVVLLPTNWPAASISIANLVPPVRALENHIYFVTANRIGTERGTSFIGRSRISHPDGSNLAFADHDRQEILIAEIDPVLARQKRIVRVPGKHEVNLIADRRPELYGDLLSKDQT